MYSRFRHFAIAVLGMLSVMVPAASMACSLEPTDPVRIKQMMAKEIAYRLGMPLHQIPLNAITTPALHSPVRLDRDCRGLERWHHSAAFRIVASKFPADPGVSPMRWPEYAREQLPQAVSRRRQSSTGPGGMGAPGRWAVTSGWPGRWPVHTHCAYEGVAVVLGYGYSSPVAVNFDRECW